MSSFDSLPLFIGAILGLLQVASAAVYLLFHYGVRGVWFKGLSVAIALGVVCVGVSLPHLIVGPITSLVDRVRLGKVVAEYESQIKPLNSADGPRFAMFGRDSFMMNPIYIVYDESDQLLLPQQMWRASWRGWKTEFASCKYSANKTGQHFYIVRFSC